MTCVVTDPCYDLTVLWLTSTLTCVTLQEQPLHVVMQEALTRHMNGVKFRERGAGPELDPHMTDEGRSTNFKQFLKRLKCEL